MNIIEFHIRIMKIMKFMEFHKQKYKNNENHIIPYANQENNGNLKILKGNYKNHEIIEFNFRIMKIKKIIEFQ